MIIDFNVPEWKPNYLAFKDAGNVPPSLTQLESSPYQAAALGRRYWNPLGECFIYVLCDCTRGASTLVDTAQVINVLEGAACYVEDLGFTGTATTRRVLYNLYASTEIGYSNAQALYRFSSSKAADSDVVVKAWGLVKLLPANYIA